ncbi:hypothetical protein HDV00_008827 [Rhizophlyctis rosea]|nr:hypothetical protein HDV00_008827 [Rhizophlyctis rosea]
MDHIRVTKVSDVRLEKGKAVSTGTLHLLAHHLLFCPNEQGQEVWVTYSTIHTVDRKIPNSHGFFPVHISCRNFLHLRLFIQREQDAMDVYASLQKLLNISSIEQLYAFYYTPEQPFTSNVGWSLYDPESEFTRLGVGTKTTNWRFSQINENYEFCPTYPRVLVVPSRISDNVLKYTGKFRSKARIPALSYLHRTNMASLTRSSQPLVGLKQNRSIQDEKLVEYIFTSGQSAELGTQNLIIDARPTANAMAQTALGAGTESTDNYKGCKIVFLGIDNIHVVRESMNKLVDALNSVESGPIPRALMDKSGWLKHIRNLLDGTLQIVQNLHLHGNHVLVHCSDGWDRTAQLCSLSQLCLDPYYRTIEGLAVLIEKEWASFGFKFQDRCGHLSRENTPGSDKPSVGQQFHAARRNVSNSITSAAKSFLNSQFAAGVAAGSGGGPSSGNLSASTRAVSYPGGGAGISTTSSTSTMSSESASQNSVAPREVSPVFTQFLDCLYQLWVQFPTHFEFSDKLLSVLNTHVYSCQFGSFLFNCERERRQYVRRGSGRTVVGVDQVTKSVWDFVLSRREEFLNPNYVGPEVRREQALVVGGGGSGGKGAGGGEPGSVSADGEILFPASGNLKYWAGSGAGGSIGRSSTPTSFSSLAGAVSGAFAGGLGVGGDVGRNGSSGGAGGGGGIVDEVGAGVVGGGKSGGGGKGIGPVGGKVWGIGVGVGAGGGGGKPTPGELELNPWNRPSTPASNGGREAAVALKPGIASESDVETGTPPDGGPGPDVVGNDQLAGDADISTRMRAFSIGGAAEEEDDGGGDVKDTTPVDGSSAVLATSPGGSRNGEESKQETMPPEAPKPPPPHPLWDPSLE